MLRAGGGGVARLLGQAAGDGKVAAQRLGPLSLVCPVSLGDAASCRNVLCVLDVIAAAR